MTCAIKFMKQKVADYLIDHEEDLPAGTLDADDGSFDRAVTDLVEEFEAAVTDRWIEWRDARKAQ